MSRALCCAAGRSMTKPIRTLISNVNVVDVMAGGIVRDTCLLMCGGLIAEPSGPEAIGSLRVVDARGCWAIPSYVDMHAHTTFEGRGHHLPAFSFDEPEDVSVTRGAQNLIEALRSGVCLVRDVGSRGKRSMLLKELVDTGTILGPELVLSGEPLCLEGGYGVEFGQTLSHRSLAMVLESHRTQGHEWLKIMNGPQLFDQHFLGDVVDACHRLGLKVAAHAFTRPGIRDAIQAGVDTVEHGVVFSEHLAGVSRENRTQFVPTYYCSWISVGADYITTVDDSAYSTSLRDWHEFLETNLSHHVRMGMPVFVGTDAGSAPCTFSDITCEIKMLSRRGLSALDAIRSATILPAKALGREGKYGSISVGKWANLILLGGNPLEDIAHVEDVRAIWYRGIIVFNRVEAPCA